jgi:hypothetical protein
MNLYGYDSSSEELQNLVEVTIQAKPDELRIISQFFLKCADEMEKAGSEWEHEHFRDYLNSEDGHPDIIVIRGSIE